MRTSWYRFWLVLLWLCVAAGLWAYARQYTQGLGITGLSQQVSWGLYIAQFTFMVGVAASALTLLVPACLHKRPAYLAAAPFGEALAASAVCTAMLCVLVDLGRPQHVLNLLLHPRPSSLMFWDVLALAAYLGVSLMLVRERIIRQGQGLQASARTRVLLPIALALAIGIHVVTALIYAGLGARPYWLTAAMAAHFISSACASGPALLILLLLGLRRMTAFDGLTAIQPGLRLWMAYALPINLALCALEAFTALYGGRSDLNALWRTLWSAPGFAPVFWAWGAAAIAGLCGLFLPRFRNRGQIPAWGAACVLLAVWLDKGPGLILGGFAIDPFGEVRQYIPTWEEAMIVVGIHATGLLILFRQWRGLVFFRQNSQLAP